jgi:hypothetical protein
MTRTKGGQETIGTAPGTSGSITLNLNTGNVFKVTPSGAFTALAISNVPSSVGVSVRLKVANGAIPRDVPLPTGGYWVNATPVAVANKVMIYDYYTDDGGSTWACSGGSQV